MSTLKVNNIQSFSDGVQSVVLNDDIGISGSVTISGSITPSDYNAHDIGNSNFAFRHLHLAGDAHVRNISASNMPTQASNALSGQLFTLSGSQIFSSSAFPGGSNPVFASGDFSASLFVFKKA